MSQRALVTGGAGFIGSHLVDRLIKEGWTVDLVDNLSSGHKEFINSSSHAIINNFDADVVLERVRGKHYDHVFHIAAVPRVSYSVEHPLVTHDNNVTKTLRLIDACRGNVKKFIFASSSSVYGGASTLPTPEDYGKFPKSPYALQKSIIEDYLTQYNSHYGLDSACLRFFNVFGPRQIGGSPYSTAVSSWLTAIKSGQPMRSDGDGSQSRDLCYVDNVVEACFLAAMKQDKLGGMCFNVACGERTTNKEILEYLLKRYPGSQWYGTDWRPGDVMHTQACLNKSSKILGYKPLVKFWDGLEKTIQWYETSWELIKTYEVKKC